MRKRLGLPGRAAAAGGLAVLAMCLGEDVRSAPRDAGPIAARPVSGGAPLGTTSVSPAFLPAGATLFDLSGHANHPGVSTSQYALAGTANADTIPAGGLDATTALTTHPATYLTVTFVPGVVTLPAVPGDPAYVDARPVTVAGLPAVLSVPRSGYGVHRVDWVDSAGYHVVLCDRLDTVDGVSGITADELVRVAASLYD